MNKEVLKPYCEDGFSLIELMLSLIIISCITAAFTPVITKKINSSSSSASTSEVTTSCEKFTSECSLCYSDKCIMCLRTCNENQYKNNDTCLCENCSDKSAGCLKCDKASCNLCASGYGLTSDGKCQLCSAGYYSDGTYDCKACPVDQYQSQDGKSSCIACSSKTSNCTACNAENGTCTACANKYYLNSSLCSICPAGYKCVNNSKTQCPAGQYSAQGSTSCTSCPAGKYSAAGATSCTSCSTTWSNCTACSVSGCSACNANYKLSGGKCVEDGCLNPGYYKSGSTCKICEAGYYCPDKKNRYACTGSTYTKTTGQTSCKTCPSIFVACTIAGQCSNKCDGGGAGTSTYCWCYGHHGAVNSAHTACMNQYEDKGLNLNWWG